MSQFPLLCRREDALLLVIDIQERLAAAMPEEARESVHRNTATLLEGARLLEIPAVVSEQYPKGLGPTSAPVKERAGWAAFFEKTCFSCRGAEDLFAALRGSGRKQVVIAGMEAHVCVVQTALELHGAGFEVFVASDAICSRRQEHKQNALDRMNAAGVAVTNTESVLFEWLRDAGHEHFKAISRLVR